MNREIELGDINLVVSVRDWYSFNYVHMVLISLFTTFENKENRM